MCDVCLDMPSLCACMVGAAKGSMSTSCGMGTEASTCVLALGHTEAMRMHRGGSHY